MELYGTSLGLLFQSFIPFSQNFQQPQAQERRQSKSSIISKTWQRQLRYVPCVTYQGDAMLSCCFNQSLVRMLWIESWIEGGWFGGVQKWGQKKRLILGYGSINYPNRIRSLSFFSWPKSSSVDDQSEDQWTVLLFWNHPQSVVWVMRGWTIQRRAWKWWRGGDHPFTVLTWWEICGNEWWASDKQLLCTTTRVWRDSSGPIVNPLNWFW